MSAKILYPVFLAITVASCATAPVEQVKEPTTCESSTAKERSAVQLPRSKPATPGRPVPSGAAPSPGTIQIR